MPLDVKLFLTVGILSAIGCEAAPFFHPWFIISVCPILGGVSVIYLVIRMIWFLEE